jgi:hypothetical protein
MIRLITHGLGGEAYLNFMGEWEPQHHKNKVSVLENVSFVAPNSELCTDVMVSGWSS